MCETRDLGIMWSHWHTLILEGEVRVDVRYVCPKDVKKLLLQGARTVHWKKRAVKHQYEELKEGAWLEPALALLQKKTKRDWTEKHRNAARKLLLEGGWCSKGFSTLVGRMEVSVKRVTKQKRYRKAQTQPLPRMARDQKGDPRVFQKVGAKSENVEGGVEVAKRYCHASCESQWNRGRFSKKKWESQKHKSWSIPAEGLMGHVTSDDSLLGRAGKWGACGGQWCSWIMMKGWGPCTGCMARWRRNLRSSALLRGRS